MRRSVLLLPLLCVLCLLSTAVHALPTFEQVRAQFASSDALLLDRNGHELHRLRTNMQVRRGQWVALQDMSPALRTAMLLSEDRRFYEHSGVDWYAVGAAAWGNMWNDKTRGASTITMQLVGLLDVAQRQGRRSLWQKLDQATSARLLDAQWRKDHILEAYLNLVPYRGEIVGIDALSRTLFGKAAHGLDAREAAVAAALVRAPNATPRAVADRACGVLAQLQRTPRSTLLCDSLSLFVAGVMQRRAWSPDAGLAAHAARQLLARQPGGAHVRSTISAALQQAASAELARQLHELRGRNVRDGAVLVLDNATGDVLAWVGSNPSTSRAAEVDFTRRLRQPGSTLKPFLYAQAIAERRLTAASLLHDSPAAIPTPGGLYIPQNYDRHFRGWVSVRTALGSSLNVPAVRTIGMVGVNAFAQQLRQLGIDLPRPGDYYGYSLALGSADMSLWQLTNAYRTLANGGRFSPVRTHFTDVAQQADTAPFAPAMRPVLDAGAAYIISHILSDNNARIPTFGSNSLLHTRFWSAVKTGTSKDMRDNWAVGYSQRYTVGVWVGNADNSPMWDVSGTSGAAPVWAAVMRHLHAGTPSHAPTPPAGVQIQPVRFASADAHQPPPEASRNEWFLTGTAQPIFGLTASANPHSTAGYSGLARITSPSNGTIIAIDPDIPPQRQRLQLRSNHPSAQWWIDGRRIAQGATAQWLPWPGRHRIELRLPGQMAAADSVQIEVRGAGVRHPR